MKNKYKLACKLKSKKELKGESVENIITYINDINDNMSTEYGSSSIKYIGIWLTSDYVNFHYERIFDDYYQNKSYFDMLSKYKHRFGTYLFFVRNSEGDSLVISSAGYIISEREETMPELTWFFKNQVLDQYYDGYVIEDYFDDPQNIKSSFQNRYLRHRRDRGFTHIPEYAWPTAHWKEDHKIRDMKAAYQV